MILFDRGSIKELWRAGDYDEVGRWEIALLAAYEGRDGISANAQINDYGGMTYSIVDFDAIKSIKKKILRRKMKNMDTLKTWVNESLPSKLFQIREGQLLMSYAQDGKRYNEGEVLTNQIFEPTGPRQLKSDCAQIIRHILFTNPRLGLCSFPDIFACMFLLVSGQAATEKEIPSASIIRSHMTKLNNYNLHYQRQACVALANDLSPCGNSRKCGYVTDDTKHGSNNK